MQVGVSEGRRRLMLRRWKYAVRVTLLMWASKVKVPSSMTPRLLTWGDGGTMELSIDMEKGLCFGLQVSQVNAIRNVGTMTKTHCSEGCFFFRSNVINICSETLQYIVHNLLF